MSAASTAVSAPASSAASAPRLPSGAPAPLTSILLGDTEAEKNARTAAVLIAGQHGSVTVEGAPQRSSGTPAGIRRRPVSDRVPRPPASSASRARSLRSRQQPCRRACDVTPDARPGSPPATPPLPRGPGCQPVIWRSSPTSTTPRHPGGRPRPRPCLPDDPSGSTEQFQKLHLSSRPAPRRRPGGASRRAPSWTPAGPGWWPPHATSRTPGGYSTSASGFLPEPMGCAAPSAGPAGHWSAPAAVEPEPRVPRARRAASCRG
jgi:hypothetical protein